MRTVAKLLAVSFGVAVLAVHDADGANVSGVIVCPAKAPANVKLAAKEVRRYVYLRTGKLHRNGNEQPG